MGTRLGTWGMQTEFPLFPPALPYANLGSWEFSFGRRAPERELPTAYPSPIFPTEMGRLFPKENSLEAPWGRGGGERGDSVG